MKNLTYYPFSRNRYFNGKLLTAQDFELEQRYMNDKRRLLNRWILGCGVAAGLEVVQVDDYSISLEMGLALDQAGREIFVESPSIRKLSLLDGYEEATGEEGSESLYLCIEYSQTEAEPVHNINSDVLHGDQQLENSKYREGYHLYVTDDEPADTGEGRGFGDEEAYIAARAEQIGHGAYQRGIYLARIYLVKAGPFFMIDRIERQPFHQYVAALPLTAGRLRELRQSVMALRQRVDSLPPGGKGGCGEEREKNPHPEWLFAEGTVQIPVPPNSRSGNILYSEPLTHGLGPGAAQLLFRVISGDEVECGAPGIFKDKTPQAEIAGRLNRRDGSFIVGLRLCAETEKKNITVGWTAIKSRREEEREAREPRLFIQPGMVSVGVRAETQLTPVGVNLEQSEVRWQVIQPDGGSIDESGRYHAPGTPGVYEVEAESIFHPGLKASAFVIVRDA